MAASNQALADYLCALALRESDSFPRWNGISDNAHAVLSKLQQAVEKMLKAFLLYENPNSYDPFKGHLVITPWRSDRGSIGRRLHSLLDSIGQRDRKNLDKLMELESLAPKGIRDAPRDQEYCEAIDINTEYPFHNLGQLPLYPANYFSIDQTPEFLKAVKWLFKSMSDHPPYEFTSAIKDFFRQTGF